MAKARILIVDDEDSIRFGMRDFPDARGYAVAEADSCQQALQSFQDSPPNAAVLDYRLHDGNAIELLHQFKRIDPDIPAIVLTAYGSIELAVEAVKEGAEQFLTKPIELPTLLVILERLLVTRRLKRRQRAISAREKRDEVNPLLGQSAAIRALAAQVQKVVASDSAILITGETGTGKSLLARWLHRHGPRADEPFVDLNCAGLSPEFLETELFGHRKGAFTGALADKKGLLEIADGGSVFLDEIGDVDLRVQPKLLKVLEERRFRRLGGLREREVDVALITATHQNLAARVDSGEFRGDLYYRISSIPLHMPALRERPEDIPNLACGMLQRMGGDLGRSLQLDDAAQSALVHHPWPGNIREMRNVLERAALLCEGGSIGVSDLRFEASGSPPAAADADTSLTLLEVERQHIERVLREVGGKVDKAAQRLDVPRSSLYQKIKNYGIRSPRDGGG